MIDVNDYLSKGWMIAAGVVGWVYRGHVTQDKEAHASHVARLTAIEATQATRADIARLYDKLEVVGGDLHTSQREIMNTLLAAKLALNTEKREVRERLELAAADPDTEMHL